MKKWARVFLLCGGVVEKQFVFALHKVKSENELYVRLLKQSVGYNVISEKAIIRRGHDGIWRVHSRPVSWP